MDVPVWTHARRKGGGGGQKNLATAGGQDVSNLKAVIEKVKSLLLL